MCAMISFMPEELLEYHITRYPGQTGKHTRTLQQRIADFWSYVNRNGPTPPHCPELGPCWPWTGGVLKSGGYGQMNINHKMWRCHRLSWIIANGPIPDGMTVCHKCDNPPCVNPSHLWLGTHQDNTTDMIQKGREKHPSGEAHNSSKLTEANVYSLKKLWITGEFPKAHLGRIFNIDRGHVGMIIKGTLWKTVPNPPGWPGSMSA